MIGIRQLRKAGFFSRPLALFHLDLILSLHPFILSISFDLGAFPAQILIYGGPLHTATRFLSCVSVSEILFNIDLNVLHELMMFGGGNIDGSSVLAQSMSICYRAELGDGLRHRVTAMPEHLSHPSPFPPSKSSYPWPYVPRIIP